ncbi:hypothetical protein LTR53_014901 [Teratosphaeriaceae sp. CCFEE 6253]|nr:hypothetical protein LTR53_014901 [Teratosphaeriaceae sp. CCFEE 6253]
MVRDMWEQESTQNDKPSARRYTAKGHLPIPALSPIDEKGSPGIDLVAGLELHHDQDGRPPDVLDEILPLAEYTGANGVVGTREAAVPSTPRLPKGDAVLALRLSPRQLQDLVTEPNSLPIRPATPPIEEIPTLEKDLGIAGEAATQHGRDDRHMHPPKGQTLPPLASVSATPGAIGTPRPSRASRSASTPLFHRKQSSAKSNRAKPELPRLRTEDGELSLERSTTKPSPKKHVPMSPHLSILPVPPLSLPAYLQLELSSDRPSELYIHRAPGSDQMYESSKVKFDRLMNFLLLPPSLEQVLWFGAVACLDAWLYSFTTSSTMAVSLIAMCTTSSPFTPPARPKPCPSNGASGLEEEWQATARSRHHVLHSAQPTQSDRSPILPATRQRQRRWLSRRLANGKRSRANANHLWPATSALPSTERGRRWVPRAARTAHRARTIPRARQRRPSHSSEAEYGRVAIK